MATNDHHCLLHNIMVCKIDGFYIFSSKSWIYLYFSHIMFCTLSNIGSFRNPFPFRSENSERSPKFSFPSRRKESSTLWRWLQAFAKFPPNWAFCRQVSGQIGDEMSLTSKKKYKNEYCRYDTYNTYNQIQLSLLSTGEQPNWRWNEFDAEKEIQKWVLYI